MTTIEYRTVPTNSPTQHGSTLMALLFSLTTATTAMAQDARTDARRQQAGARSITFGETSEVTAPPITARTWLGSQASGTMASPHKQTLGGPIMSGVYQKMRKQLSGGKGSSEAGASTENEASGDKDNAMGDLGKALGNAKP